MITNKIGWFGLEEQENNYTNIMFCYLGLQWSESNSWKTEIYQNAWANFFHL